MGTQPAQGGTTSAPETFRLSGHGIWLIGCVLAAIQQGYDYYAKLIWLPAAILGVDQRQVVYHWYEIGKLPSPLAYRPLTFWLEDFFMRFTPFNLTVADLCINTLATAFAFLGIVRYAQQWLQLRSALLAGFWVLFTLTIGYQEHTHQMADLPNLAFASWLYVASSQPSLRAMLTLCLLATLNRESFVLLLCYPWLLHLQEGTFRRFLAPLLGAVLACLVTGGVVFALVGPAWAQDKFWMFSQNITPDFLIAWLPDVLLGLGPGLMLSLWGWRRLPIALQAGVLASLLYLGMMLVVGRMPEFRLLFPILPLLCVAGVAALETGLADSENHLQPPLTRLSVEQ